ncbi:MAG: Asp-tRNA(Asn)/Glu-tRNA(Gln) amidotransferase subunit GatA [Lachnospiraceae bacterium]|nr:Asp-tRNA(Asn)/Glu-tRNA(Gln) amidotransferase subunit GatA [Lachnospiraceae bacterium]
MDINELSALELGQQIQKKEISVKEAVEASFQKIEEKEPTLNCYVTTDYEGALLQAEAVQDRINRGERMGALAGVPIAVKDNICTKNLRTTCSSKMLYNFVPTYDSEAVTKLKNAGLIILGKTNMDEFGMGSTTETSYYGVTKNPWDITRVPGGSSGGSCAAVAAKETFLALGTDTGGSIRQPSAFCGVTGLKPTYGTVSRYGLIAYGSSLEQIGPIGKNVSDCAALLELIYGRDVKDSTSVVECDASPDGSFMGMLKEDVRGLRIGIPKEFLAEGLNEEVKASVLKAAHGFEENGAIVEEFSLANVSYAIPAYYIIASCEASSNLGRYDGVKYGYRSKEYQGLTDMYRKSRTEGFGTEVKRRIMLGSFALSSGYYEAYYLKALKARTLMKQEFEKAFAKYDLILGPTAPTTAMKLGENLQDPIQMYLGDMDTIFANMTGCPAISIPCGMDSKGLPIGLQLMANCFREDTLIQAAYAYERFSEA